MKYIIDFDNAATQEEIDAWLAAISITQFTCTASIGQVYIVECPTEPQVDGIVTSIVADVNISSQLLATDESLTTTVGPTASFNNTTDWWKVAVVRDPDFSNDTTQFKKRGAKSAVYVVDSGISPHADFAGVDIQNLHSFTDSFGDTSGHGTAIASIVSGVESGISVAKIKNVKIFDSVAQTMLSDIVNAIDAIHADIVASTGVIPVVNLSWAIPKNAYVEQMIQTLIDAGALVVAAAGNNGVAIENVTPASMASVLTIGAYDQAFVPCDFSNYTSSVTNTEGATNYGALDGWAPGVDISVATIDGAFGNAAGTSMAAAIVSASLAYNSDLMFDLTGPVVDFGGILIHNSFGRPGMLQLTDKYSASVNLIATITTQATALSESGTYTATRVIYADRPNAVLVVDNVFVTHYDLDSELPDGLSLSNGWIVGTPTIAPNEPTAMTYKVSVQFESGASTSFALTLHLMPVVAKPEDMQVMIEALGTCGGTNTPQANCSGQCAFMTNCYWGGKSSGCLCPV